VLLERRSLLSICKVVLVIKRGDIYSPLSTIFLTKPITWWLFLEVRLVPPFDIQRYLTRYIIVIIVKEHKWTHINMFVL
jgi:hypothetical protein